MSKLAEEPGRDRYEVFFWTTGRDVDEVSFWSAGFLCALPSSAGATGVRVHLRLRENPPQLTAWSERDTLQGALGIPTGNVPLGFGRGILRHRSRTPRSRVGSCRRVCTEHLLTLSPSVDLPGDNYSGKEQQEVTTALSANLCGSSELHAEVENSKSPSVHGGQCRTLFKPAPRGHRAGDCSGNRGPRGKNTAARGCRKRLHRCKAPISGGSPGWGATAPP